MKNNNLFKPKIEDSIKVNQKMGRIKSTLIKRTSRELLKHENVFSEEFDRNKKVLGNLLPSKRIRNKIAGYISRLKRKQMNE